MMSISFSNRSVRRHACIGLALSCSVLFAACSDDQAPNGFKISVVQDGVYAVAYESLQSAGLHQPVHSDGLRLTLDGVEVPIWVADGADGEFGEGDHFEFVGSHAKGDRSHFSEHDILNHYRLSLAAEDSSSPARYSSAVVEDLTRGAKHNRTVRVERHLEQDQLLVRFSARREGENPEPWYWARLTQLNEPWKTSVQLQDLPKVATPISLRVALRGWSSQRRRGRDPLAPKDHRVEVMVAGQQVGVGEWDGQDEHIVEIEDVSAFIKSGSNTISLRVPRRKTAQGDTELVDVVLLNWVELSYDRLMNFRQMGFEGEAREGPLFVRSTQGSSGAAFVADQRLDLASLADDPKLFAWQTSRPGEMTYAPVLFEPEAITADYGSSLRATDQQADYLMITPRHLKAEVEPLADFHRDRGLSTTIVEIDDVYDEFSHGQTNPRAVKDFISHAYHEWQEPKPRFVLLVGDASWDVRNLEGEDHRYADWTYRSNEVRRFAKNASTSYSEEQLRRHRNLIPTWRYHTFEGQAASDNYFVAVDGDDYVPDLAIGRFPVTEPEEVRAIVQKTIRYVEQPEVGPWRRNILWVTNEDRNYQRNNERFAKALGDQGYGALRVYPKPEEQDNSQHQQSLIDAFDQGVSVVNFIGHGGRYIWRTGPPDPTKNHDLFTLEHLDELQPTEKLPVVVSLTCYSAPFDHPTADSIGEKFLRMSDRGAIGVFAASWRNSPSARFSESLMSSLVNPEFASIGEALTWGKSQIRNPVIVNTYNYLGDPAVPMVRPTGAVDLEYSPAKDQLLVQLHKAAPVPQTDTSDRDSVAEEPVQLAELGAPVKLDATAIVEWVSEAGDVLREMEIEIDGGSGSASCGGGCDGAASVRAYAWSQRKRWDAVGSLTLPTARAAAQ